MPGRMKNGAMAAALAAAVLLGGCGSSRESAVPVQSVAMLCDLEDVMQQQMFTGIVSTGNEANIKKDSSKKVGKVYVKKGDLVQEGDKLFSYDAEQVQNSLEKARLELEEQQNTLSGKIEERDQLEADKAKAKSEDQLAYMLKIQEANTDIREATYNIGIKEKEIQKLEAGTQNLDVTAPFDGRIEKAGVADVSTTEVYGSNDDVDTDLGMDDYGYSEEGEEVFIKLVETDNYRIKGSINESNINLITVGMPMIIHSRVDDSVTWKGVVSNIDYKTPSSNKGSGDYYGEEESDEMTTSSKYPFYVSLEGLDGLMIGQHVYMTEDMGSENGGDEIRLSSSFLNDISASPWVWAEVDGALGKRQVELGEYSAEEDTYVITSGLVPEDYIAVPSDRYKEGMPVVENDLTAFEADESMSFDLDDEGGDTFSYEEDYEDFEDFGDLDDMDIEDLEALYREAGEEVVG